MRANFRTLLNVAARTDKQVTAGSWSAQRHYHRPTVIVVHHYTTPMFEYDWVSGEVTPITPGIGSSSDKSGVTRILAGAGVPMNYAALYPSTKKPSHRVTRSK